MPIDAHLRTTPSIVMALLLFALLIVTYVLASRFRALQQQRNPAFEKTDLTAINGMLLGLLGLMLAFTFSMANERYDMRRGLIVEESNSISSAVLRADVLPDSVRTRIRSMLKVYVDERIAFYEVGMDLNKAYTHFMRADSISSKTWQLVTAYARVNHSAVLTSGIIGELNAMMDITTTRRAAGEAQLPNSIIYFLFALCFSSAFLLGYDHKGPLNWVIVVGFSLMLSATVFTILDLDQPRSGLINMDATHQRMVDLKKMF